MRVSHIEHHIEQQLSLSSLIINAYDNLIKYGMENVASQRINVRLTALKENWERFLVAHDAITLLPTFFHHARLPRLDLPKFNGTPSDWLPFKDLFRSLVIDNPTLSPVEKLQYLKTSLTGTAVNMLSNTTLTADNFFKAWDSLISFYENRRLLVNAALSSLLNLKRITRESASELEKLYTTVIQIYRTLETLARPVNSWDDFLIFIVVQQLDAESVKVWEQHIGSSKELLTWK
ncbi:hypothetical protein ALC62_14824 [Cyphomyrmex costatus]|uniref:Uncharacterized protein n=1 Tax=Cyphomyrmex costatus TaxID=456900 RepID=A0A151I8A4_9HYME|nr:hypothetical protein ALC62_14824 [Cyphomyrmex costatus]